MKWITSKLRKLDIFGVPYSFKYKSEENYTSSIGGLVFLLFAILCLTFGIYYFIPFYNRKNFTAYYYTLSTPQADVISFSESKTAMAFGLHCWTANDGTTADKLFKVDFKYIHWKYEDNDYKRTISTLGSHPCTKKDFYNAFDEAFDMSEIYDYECLDDPSITIEGIWTSEIFSYFQFEVNAKNESQELLDKIDNYLYENDCKFQIYFSDNSVDIEDYANPIKSFVEAIFIQINPTLSIRRNLYFMNQYLYDDDSWFWVFTEDNEPEIKKTLFSRFEEYSLFQGLKRQENYTDYLNFVKLYIRADTKKTEIKRNYEKINEFFAEEFSLLIVLYEILNVIFKGINSFWSEQSLSKKIFFFQDFDHKLNIQNKTEKIKELLQVTDPNKIRFKSLPNNSINKKIENINNSEINSRISKPISYYASKNLQIFNNLNNLNNIKTQGEENKQEIPLNYQKISNSIKGRDDKSDILYNFNCNTINKKSDMSISHQSTENNLCTNNNSDKESTYEEKDDKKIEYEYNLCDKLRTIICKCCLSKELKIKNDLNQKAMDILDNKLDIEHYVRNMILIDIINEIILDKKTESILNFLGRPIICLKDNDEEEEFSFLYHKYKEADFEQFYNEVIQLSNKANLKKKEAKLLFLCNKHLKQIKL